MAVREESNINWRNIYYFMSYCLPELRPLEVGNINYEEIKGLYDLQATILNLGFDNIRRFGVEQTYKTEEIVTNNPKGRINFTKTVNSGKIMQGKFVCSITKVTEDTEANQKLKLAFKIALSYQEYLSIRTIDKLKRNLKHLDEVSDITVKDRSLHVRYQVKPFYRPALAISDFIISNKIIQDSDSKYRSFSKNEGDTPKYIWEKFLRNFLKEYMHSIDSEYKVTKESRDVAIGVGSKEVIKVEPDICIYKNKEDSLCIIMDAKWYENPNMRSVYHQMNSYGTDMQDLIKNKKTKVLAIFGFNETDSDQYINMRGSVGTYDLYKYVINVNQDFESIKQDIRNMVNEQLELV